MADKAMNEFNQITDFEYIYAEATNGSQVKISKEDIEAAPKFSGIVYDFDNITRNGIYQYDMSETDNTPSPYGILIQLSNQGGQYSHVWGVWIAQIAFSTSGVVFYRFQTNGNVWTEWKKFSFA